MGLYLVPTTISDANAFVEQHHRHHKPAHSHLFAVSVGEADEIVGVAIVGRPVARHLEDGWTCEVVRVATLGNRNACSMLYGAAWRAARALGYRRCVTYTLESEEGGSLRGAGWTCIGKCGGGTWAREGRPRVDKHPTQRKFRWERLAKPTDTPKGGA
jgi:hypothetical protein